MSRSEARGKGGVKGGNREVGKEGSRGEKGRSRGREWTQVTANCLVGAGKERRAPNISGSQPRPLKVT